MSDVKVPGDVSDAHLDELQQRVHRSSKGHAAPDLIFQAVKASATLPFEAGKEIEMEIFKELSGGYQAKALQYQFFAERKVNTPPAEANPKNIPTIQAMSVVGGGTMGTGIVMSLINAGLHVVWVESSEKNLDAAIARVGKIYRASSAYKSGKMTEADIIQRFQLITPTTNMNKLQHVDMVIEAVYEDMKVKKEVFTKLDKICKPSAVLATNTSTMDIDEIASAASKARAPNIVGTRKFF